ncbi:ubiquitin-associated domain-containing protein 1-like isoform X1 [Mytilus galloprovincialis]|uniref:ubiquitin-associated domain-containing protein 1-like isoform X1 n=1 Tax=Mytilus galloprovincialis TaxID=29158 RepID=UPI003F7B5609
MYVSDSNIFPSKGMRIRICHMDGRNYVIDLNSNIKIDELKIMSLSHFNDPAESIKTSLYHKVLLVRTGQVLSEEKTISEEGVKENDELLLLKKRLTPSPLESKDGLVNKDESRKGPTAEEIKEITGELSATKRGPQPEVSNDDFHSELQKILVALVELSQKLLCMNPDVSKLFKGAEAGLSNETEVMADKDLVKQLTDMGFSESKVTKALEQTKNSFNSAMEWLLQHALDPEPENTQEDQVEGATGITLPETIKEDTDQSNLQSLRALGKKEFKPNPQALLNLVEMGFDEAEVIEALKVSRNEQNGACEWLLGDRKTRIEESEPEGLDSSSQMYKALVSNPNVQLGLNNPRCLLAMIQLLESPLTLHQWLSDPETGPFIVHITRIYHSWKYSSETDNDGQIK